MSKRNGRSDEKKMTKFSGCPSSDRGKKGDRGPALVNIPFHVSTLKSEEISDHNPYRLYRNRKWHRRIRVSESSKRNSNKALKMLNRLSSDMDIPEKIREDAFDIYREAVDKKLIRDWKVETLSAGALYAGSRKTNFSCTLKDFEDHLDVSKKDIEKTYRYLSKELDIKLLPPTPDEYIDRFCDTLDLSGHTKERCELILKEASKRGIISGKSPTSVAAASIYISSLIEDQPRNQKDIAKVAGVTEVTIRNRYKELINKLDINIENKK